MTTTLARLVARRAVGVLGLIGAVAVWELVTLTGGLRASGLPGPLLLARRLGTLADDPGFRAALLATVLAWVIALVLTVALAVPAGLLLGSIPLVRTATDVLVEMVRPVPGVALIPLALVTLGAGPTMKITLAVFAGTWPVLFAVLAGLRSVDSLWLDTARSLHTTPTRIVWRVRLPVVTSFALTGVRLAASVELIVLVSTEFLAGEGYPGVGAYLNITAEQIGDLTTLLAGALLVGLLGVVMGGVLLALRRPWHALITAAGTTHNTPSHRQRLIRFAQRWAWFTAWVGVWELVTMRARSVFAPSPTSILAAADHLWHTPLAATTIGISLTRLGLGWSLAILVGVGGGLLLGCCPVLADLVEPPATFLRTLPTVLLLPVLVAWVPIGTPLSVTIIALGAVWPILLHTLDGVRAVDATMVDTARAYRTPLWRRLGWVMLPAAGPRILAGLRISVSLALILMLVSELAGASNGIGYQLAQTQALFDFPAMWAWVVLTGVLGYLFNRGVLLAGRLALPWHHDPLI